MVTIAGELIRDSKRHIINTERQRLYDLGDTVVADVLDPIVREAADKIAKAAPAAASLHSDADLTRVGPKPREAWVLVTHERERITRVHVLAERLRTIGITYDVPPPAVPRECWRFANIDALAVTSDRPLHDNTKLMLQIENGAEPRCLTAQEVREIYLEPSEAK